MLHSGAQGLHREIKLACDLLEFPLLGFNGVVRDDLLRPDQVKARLGLVRIRDRRGAHLEVALGLGQLLGDGGLLRPHQRQVALRCQ